ncbi:hypothetical protein BH24ACT5_BH24ACT5_15510 [soil metagenome]
MTSTYHDFLVGKAPRTVAAGLPITAGDVHPILFDHQRAIVEWAVRGGRRAIFAAFGLGKSLMQLETLRLVTTPGARALIVCPLGVRAEFRHDAEMIGVDITFIRRTEDVAGPGIYITNYESIRDGKLDVTMFEAVSLDEASVLRSYGSKTFVTFLELFDTVRYRFVATATPSPNRYKELIHYAGFLGIMDTGQALTRFFQRDSTQASNLTLYPHKEREFWLWLSSWAVFLQSPADLGYSAEGYDLPSLTVEHHEVETDPMDVLSFDSWGQGQMVEGGTIALTQAARVKRATLDVRVAEMMRLIAANGIGDDGDQVVLWCDLNDEQRAIERALDAAGISYSSVFGALDIDESERRIQRWKDRETCALIGKPVMLGQGLNLQQCNRAIFVGLTFKFNDIIQATHRIYRFGQARPCHVHIVHADTERSIVNVINEKWDRHKELTATMSNLIREHGLNDIGVNRELLRSLGVERVEVRGDGWQVANNDCVLETGLIADATVDLIVTSIPFANHYEYTPSFNDFGHTDDNDHFWAQMDYLTPDLLRVLAPGRIYACHVKDRILFGNVTGAGASTVSPFHAEAIMHGRKHGFDYMGMITVVTDVVRENNQTYRLGWSEQAKDGTKMGVGSPEYILLFRRPQSDRSKGYADVPVAKDKADYTRSSWQVDAHAFWRSGGDRPIKPDEWATMGAEQVGRLFSQLSMTEVYDWASHIEIGDALDEQGRLPATFMQLAPGSWHPDVWHDIARMLTLNTEQSRKAQALHVCLARGSLVLTRAGYKPIQEVAVGEHVLTHRGRWRPVLAVQNTGVRPVVEVRAQGVPGVTLTPDHKMWTRAVRDLPWSRHHSRAEAGRTEPRWVEAADTVGSYVNLKLPPTEAPSTPDPVFWWTVGRWLADGHIDKRGGAHISCGRHKLADLQARLERFGGNPERDPGTCYQVLLRDPGGELRRTLKACGHGAGGKHLPPEAYTLPAAEARALLDGYLSGDGHYLPDRSRWTASSVSRELMLGMAMLAQRAHGAVASIYPGRPPGTAVIEGRTVTTRQDWILCFDLPDGTRRKGLPFLLDDGAWKKVRSAAPAGEVETWNLRVDEDESYTAEGCVVKNCPLQFDIVDRLIGRYSNPGELIYDPFGGLFTVPFRALHLGRRGRAAELNPQYFLDGVKYLQSAERHLAMPTLFDALGAPSV